MALNIIGRAQQIEYLKTLLGDDVKDIPIPSIFVYGGVAVGKSLVVERGLFFSTRNKWFVPRAGFFWKYMDIKKGFSFRKVN
jgi:hypothetical protein